jgi:ribosomal protein S18 acetylase RimI-like enzyme
MEYGGRDAFVDDLFIVAAHRGRGLGTAALAQARAYCVAQGVRAVHLEVARDNAPAQAVYRRAGFAGNDRQLLTLPLADPTHVG